MYNFKLDVSENYGWFAVMESVAESDLDNSLRLTGCLSNHEDG